MGKNHCLAGTLISLFILHFLADAYDDQTVKNAVSSFDKNGKVDLEL